MDYEIVIGTISRRVDISRGSGRREEYHVRASGEKPKKIFVVKRKPQRIIVSIDDRMYWITGIRRTSGSIEFILNGDLVVGKIAGKKAAQEASSDIASVNELVTSNFPAKVVKILAIKGSRMKEGETIMVLEAMKMEAQIKSPMNCMILEIFVKEGMMVSKGERLARLKFI
ncbi:MAG: biotin/lipoyl-containing protein [Nitrososphaerales archaeon]